MKKWKEINLVDDPNTLKKLSRYSYCIRYYIASDRAIPYIYKFGATYVFICIKLLSILFK